MHLQSSVMISLWLVQLLHINDRVLKRVLQMFVNSRLLVLHINVNFYFYLSLQSKIFSIKNHYVQFKWHSEKNMRLLLLQGGYLWIFQTEPKQRAFCRLILLSFTFCRLIFLSFTHPSRILSVSILSLIYPSNSLPLN